MRDNQTPAVGIGSKQLQEQIAAARMRLHAKLINLDLKSLQISEYIQRHLNKYIANLKGALQLYGRLLYLCLNNRQGFPNKAVLVDYGGGCGIISLLAAEMGIGTVIYNDIYDVSCTDVGSISKALGLKLDHIVCGDVDDLISYVQAHAICINAIVSYDVIEHIYDVESHFSKLGLLADHEFRIVYASGANSANPKNVRLVKKEQIDAEYKSRDKKWGHKDRDTLQAFLDVRKNIIAAYAPDLSLEVVEQLARSTRGLIQRDIEKCVDEFRLKGRIMYQMDHPTNTCDPYTGNWCEHLMDFDWLEEIIRKAGFAGEIMAGCYNSYGSYPKKIAKISLNAMIKILGRRSMFMAPYYVVYATFSEKGAGKDGNSAPLSNRR